MIISRSNLDILTSLYNGSAHAGLMRSGLSDCGIYKVRLLERDAMLIEFSDVLAVTTSITRIQNSFDLKVRSIYF